MASTVCEAAARRRRAPFPGFNFWSPSTERRWPWSGGGLAFLRADRDVEVVNPQRTVLFFGTWDEGAHPRTRVLREGFADHGWRVELLHAPLGLTTRQRVEILSRPSRLPSLLIAVTRAWLGIIRRRPKAPAADLVLVGYLGHFDVILARALFPRSTIVLDYLVSASDTAVDRGLDGPVRLSLLRLLDRFACLLSSIVMVDTVENIDTVPGRSSKALVVPVGAPKAWFRAISRPSRDIVFFGLYTPLQGTTTIARALASVLAERPETTVTMIGDGQDRRAAEELLQGHRVEWLDWVSPERLPMVVADHRICLGIFGDSRKARSVVPNKGYQGAAAGAVVVTSDTPPQRRHLPPSSAFVPPGDAAGLAAQLIEILSDPDMDDRRTRTREWSMRNCKPSAIVGPLLRAVSAGHSVP